MITNVSAATTIRPARPVTTVRTTPTRKAMPPTSREMSSAGTEMRNPGIATNHGSAATTVRSGWSHHHRCHLAISHNVSAVAASGITVNRMQASHRGESLVKSTPPGSMMAAAPSIPLASTISSAPVLPWELAARDHAHQPDDQSEDGRDREQEDRGTGDLADREAVVALDPVHGVRRGDAQHQHRDTAADSTDQEPCPCTGGATEQEPAHDERKVGSHRSTARGERERCGFVGGRVVEPRAVGHRTEMTPHRSRSPALPVFAVAVAASGVFAVYCVGPLPSGMLA